VNPIESALAEHGTIILDGGLSTQLELGGADLSDSLWTAKVLLEDPAAILRAHIAFLDAGADVLITASYQVSFEGFGAHGWGSTAAADALRSSVAIAREAADTRPDRRVIVAASVGSYGAILADGAEYRGHYGLTHAELVAFHRRRIEVLLDAEPDLLAIETIPSIVEARSLVDVLAGLPDACAWFAFTCADGATLADGSPFAEVIALVDESPQVVAVGVNCTAPEFVGDLIRVVRSVTTKPIVAYPNRGGNWDPVTKHWLGVKGGRLSELAPAWRRAGAALIGGCCGTDAADINELAVAVAQQPT
jgi:homocysteine S-methyltransferase